MLNTACVFRIIHCQDAHVVICLYRYLLEHCHTGQGTDSWCCSLPSRSATAAFQWSCDNLDTVIPGTLWNLLALRRGCPCMMHIAFRPGKKSIHEKQKGSLFCKCKSEIECVSSTCLALLSYFAWRTPQTRRKIAVSTTCQPYNTSKTKKFGQNKHLCFFSRVTW